MYIEQLKKNVKAVSYAMLVFTMVIGLTFIFGYCYRESTLDRTFERREKKKMENDLKKSNSVLEQALINNAKKRAEYELKYPELARQGSKGSGISLK